MASTPALVRHASIEFSHSIKRNICSTSSNDEERDPPRIQKRPVLLHGYGKFTSNIFRLLLGRHLWSANNNTTSSLSSNFVTFIPHKCSGNGAYKYLHASWSVKFVIKRYYACWENEAAILSQMGTYYVIGIDISSRLLQERIPSMQLGNY